MLCQLPKLNVFVFPKDSAGRRMTVKIPVVCMEDTIASTEKILVEKIKDFDTINYIYVTDENGKLVNIISIKEIFRSPKERKISDFPQKELIKVRSHTDQEKIALCALEHHLKAIPVIDKEDKLLGVVPSDEILSILDNENIEDFLRFAGIRRFDKTPYEIIKASSLSQVKARLPWLVIGLLGGLVAAFVVSFFENILKKELALAMFIPLVVYMCDAVGTQTQTIFVRSLAIEPRLSLIKYLWREMKAGFLIACASAALLMFLSFWQSGIIISLILGVTMLLGLTSAAFTAFFITWLLWRLKKDPALGSGPFATIVQDILSLIIYFVVASLFLGMFSL